MKPHTRPGSPADRGHRGRSACPIERAGSAEAVTLRAVAREVGIAAPSIYAHFPDRDAVLMAVVVRIFDELTEAIAKGVESAGQDPVGLWMPVTVSHGLICGFAGTGA
jgi:Bacterial regulatory proteins, tetR family